MPLINSYGIALTDTFLFVQTGVRVGVDDVFVEASITFGALGGRTLLAVVPAR